MSDLFVGKMILQPKREIMTYLATKGVRVPIIYDTLDEALARSPKKRILCRSEHPQDYEGSSDLFTHLEPEDLQSMPGSLERILSSHPSERVSEVLTGVQLHCQLLGLNYTEFIRQLSYSYWERIIGDNRVIFADSAIRGRYHIISIKDGTYSIIEGLRITEITSDDSLTIPEARKIIDIYEQIRGLLDHNHCYIVETVSTGFPSDVVFAVQVHRGVDFKRASFALSKESDVIELDNVRGSTNPEGEELMLTINYPSSFRSKPQIVVEGASTVASKYHVHPAFTEIMLRRRRLQLFPEDYLREELGFHIGRNLFFKPNCSAIIPVEDLKYLVGSLIEYNTRLVQVPVHFVSDGNIAQIRLIGTEQQSL